MDRSGRAALVAAVVVVVCVAAALIGIVGWYEGTSYVSSSEAQVTAPMAPVGALEAGTLRSWSASVGQSVHAGQILGTVVLPAAPAAPATAKGAAATPAAPPLERILAPFDGTVVQVAAVAGQTVDPGTPLAYVANLNAPSVIAYVKETAIRNVKVGDTANVRVAALPGTTLTGTVQSITLGTASTFTELPSPPPSGSLNNVTQYVPVNISLSADIGQVLPGESASVQIHIR